MKTPLHILTILFSLFVTAIVSAQCPTGNVTLSSQAEVDNFVANYPTCTTIPTSLHINGSDISDLSGLQNLTQIGGDLFITDNGALTSLSGLEGLQSIMGDLLIERNGQLISIQGLSNLAQIGGNLSIDENGALTSLSGLQNLTQIVGDISIVDNDKLNSLDGLEGLQSIAGDLDLVGNAQLSSIQALSNLTQIGENLFIGSNDALTSLSGLEGLLSIEFALFIVRNDQLFSIQALQNLNPATINTLFINDNPLLSICALDNICTYLSDPDNPRSISGNATGCASEMDIVNNCLPDCPVNVELNSQQEVNEFGQMYAHCTEISGNFIISGSDITDLSDLQNITQIGGSLYINDNGELTSLSGLEGLQTITGDLLIERNGQLSSIQGLSNLTQIGDNLSIFDNGELTSLSGLEGLQTIFGYLDIWNNNLLSSLQGLQNITRVESSLSISSNDVLTNLNGLAGLQSIAGYLSISYNNLLSSIQGLQKLTQIEEDLLIYYNPALTSLTGLEELLSISGPLSIELNPQLSSIQALQNLDPETISNLIIEDNPNLAICALDNICTYLSDPNNPRTISGNATGCASEMDIVNNCLPDCPVNVELNSQQEVNDFGQMYAHCTEISGNFKISGSNITDLSDLQNITQIGGSLFITDNGALTSLAGLEGLQSITGDLLIERNGQLSSIQGLSNLAQIGDNLSIFANGALTSLSGLEGLQSIKGNFQLLNNYQLSSIQGLQYLSEVNQITIEGNEVLTSLQGLEGLQSITGGLYLELNEQLSSIQALSNLTQIGSSLYIRNNPSLTSLNGLEGIQTIPETFFLLGNTQLSSIQALSNLTRIGTNMYIEENPALTSLDGLEGLSGSESITRNLFISDNAQLSSIQGIQNLDLNSISQLRIENNPYLSFCALDNICTYLSDPNNPRTISGNSGDCVDVAAVQNDCSGGNNTGPGTGFITTWKTNNPGTSDDNQITIPTNVNEPGYNYDVYWVEIGNPTNTGSATGITGDHTITFPSEGTYQVEITGDFSRIFFFNGGDKSKIISIDQWGDIAWTSMDNAFAGCNNLMGNATDAPDLNNVSSMANMFYNATSFNQDLNNWDVGNVAIMYQMFRGAASFNGNISGWDTEKVTSMYSMFGGAGSFNQDIGTWDVSICTNMAELFNGAGSFNQNLADWDISQVQDMGGMLTNCGLSTANYDATLIGWAAQSNLPQDLNLGAHGLTYCAAIEERQSLIDDHGWTILGDAVESADCAPITTGPGTGFITTWKTNNPGTSGNNQITIPTEGSGYNYDIYWEEVGNDTNAGSATGITGDHTITFSSAGSYQVEITGDFPRIYFNGVGDRQKILSIDQWGDIEWTSMEDAFNGASNLTGNATDVPDLSGVTSLVRMLQGSSVFNGNIGDWDVSGITNMSGMFTGANGFNQDIGSWDVSNVTNMDGMFVNAYAFNQDISSWQVGNVTNMNSMFRNAVEFSQDLSVWNVSKVTIMQRMLFNTPAFNVNIGNWDVSKVTDMFEMLSRSGLSTANYDATLIGWASQEVQPNVSLGAQDLTYCAAVEERQSLIDDYGWNITGDAIDNVNCGMVIYVSTEDGNTIRTLVYGSDAIQQLKQKIQDTLVIPVDQQILYYGEILLENGRTLNDYNIQYGDTLDLIVDQIVNHSPTVANPIPDHHTLVNNLFNNQFAANTFSDSDEGDMLTYSALLAGGGTLPAWLSFTAITRTFSGTPTMADVGAIEIVVTANDGNGGTVTDTFTLTVTDRPGVTISTTASSPTNEQFELDVEFNEAVTGFTADDINANNAAVSNLQTSDNISYTALITPTIEGSVSVQVPENVAENTYGALNTASNELVLTYDLTDPQVLTQDITVYLNANGMVTIDADDIDNGSSDAYGIASWILSQTDFDCSHLGDNTISLTVTDNAGNSADADATVTVGDNLAPVPSSQSLVDYTAQCEVNRDDLTTPTATDNCSGSVTGTTNATFPITTIGTTTITWTYEDSEGNSVTQNQDIVVEACPRIAVSVEQLAGIIAECPAPFSDLTLPTTVEITFDNESTEDVGVTWPSGNYNSSVGSYLISGTLDLTEEENPDNLTASLSIIFQDTEVPIPSSQSLTDFRITCQVLLSDLTPPTANDNCSGSITGTTDATFPITTQGTTTITWTYEDDEGNSVTQDQDIIINDNEEPTPVLSELPDLIGECSVSVTDFPTATDNCAGGIDATTNDPLQYNKKGSYTIHWTFDDGHGNTSTQQQKVIVNNTSDPVLLCPQRRIVSCDSIVTFDLPIATNECGTISVIQTDGTGLTSGSVFPVGITTLQYRTSDPNSSATCSIEIEVLPKLKVRHESGIGFGDTLHIAECLPPRISKDNLDLGPHYDGSSLSSSIYKINLPPNREFGLWKISLYTYEVEDQCGNRDYFENYVALYDLAPPVFLSFPNDTTIDTPSDLPTVPSRNRSVRIIDICRYVVWDTVITEPITDPVTQDTLAFVRRWIAEDEVGNKSFRDQRIYVGTTPDPDLNTITAHFAKEEDLIGARFPHSAGTDDIPVTLLRQDTVNGPFMAIDTFLTGNWMGRRGSLFFTSLLPGAYRLKIDLPPGYTPLHPDSLIYEDGWSDTLFLTGDSIFDLGTTLLVPGIIPDTTSDTIPDMIGIGDVMPDVKPRNSDFTAYPNPTTGRVKIGLPVGNTVDYTVFSHLGKAVLTGKAENGSEIDLSGRPDGMYFILVENGREYMETKRILLFTE